MPNNCEQVWKLTRNVLAH